MLQTNAYALSNIVPAVILTGLVVSQCSVFGQDGKKGPTGAPSGNYSNKILDSVGCVNSVPREGSIEATDQRAVKQIESEGFRHVWLTGPYYPIIFPLLQQGLQAQVTDPDGTTTYNLYGAEPDSQGRMCRLRLKVIST